MSGPVPHKDGGAGYLQDKRLREFLALSDDWISRGTDDKGLAWFRGAIAEILTTANDRTLDCILGLAISLAPRRLGKAPLKLEPSDCAHADAWRKDFNPSRWGIDQLARIALMAASYRDDLPVAQRPDQF
jgi:hypothetical protein